MSAARWKLPTGGAVDAGIVCPHAVPSPVPGNGLEASAATAGAPAQALAPQVQSVAGSCEGNAISGKPRGAGVSCAADEMLGHVEGGVLVADEADIGETAGREHGRRRR